MNSGKKLSQLALSPKIKSLYRDVKHVFQAEYYQIYEAVAVSTNLLHSIRILDTDSELYKQNPSLAATLFIQELLRLISIHPDSVVIEHFEINDKNIAYVTQNSIPLSKKHEFMGINIEKMIRGVAADASFLLNNLKLAESISIELDNIYSIKSSQEYFLGDWARSLKKKEKPTKQFNLNMVRPGPEEIDEVYVLGLKVLELNGISKENLEPMSCIKIVQMHNAAVNAVIEDLKQPEPIKKMLKKMLNKDPSTRLKLHHVAEELDNLKEEEIKPSKHELGKMIKSNDHLKSSDMIPSKESTGNHMSKEIKFKSMKSPKESMFSLMADKKEIQVVNRFAKQAGGWLCSGKIDAITFRCSKDIELLGVGIYIPKSSNNLSGTVKVIKGENLNGEILASREVTLTENMIEAQDKIYGVMFDKNIAVKAGTLISISSQLQKGPSFNGVGGMMTVMGDDGEVVFTFLKNPGSTNGTDVSNGQIPEIYYST